MFFEHDKGKTHFVRQAAVQRPHHSCYRGSWLDFEFDPKDICTFRVDRRRKMPVTILLKSIGLNPEQILAHFFVFDNFRLMDVGAQMEFVATVSRVKSLAFDITDKNGARHRREGQAHHRPPHAPAGAVRAPQHITVPEDFLLGRVLAQEHGRPATRVKSSPRPTTSDRKPC